MAPTSKGVSHVALTVTDIDRSKEWYGRVLGWAELIANDEDGTSASVGILPDGLVLAFHAFESGSGDEFDPLRTGLDHLAFGVEGAADLDEWAEHLGDLGVTFSPRVDAPYGHVLSFKDPDGIALELFCLPSPPE
jgi:glyoxylase I family protein